ncbi:MAG TPA: DUF433 domain-containing protein [Gemmataceae bacterium]|nr:DUF433 domain-containing protein [Gemmataceae bacterium]
MILTVQPHPVPIRVDEHGVARVGNSQVLLDIVIREFNNGAEPETISHGYPTLELADVYSVIGYYLRHRMDVDQYLLARQQEAEALRREIEAKQPDRAALRAKLLARKAQMELEKRWPKGTSRIPAG